MMQGKSHIEGKGRGGKKPKENGVVDWCWSVEVKHQDGG